LWRGKNQSKIRNANIEIRNKFKLPKYKTDAKRHKGKNRSQKTEVRKGVGISEYQVAGHQGKRDSSEIVHAPNLKNKIGAGSALILSLRNSGENPNRFNVKRVRKNSL
jgi:hypothetical protein